MLYHCPQIQNMFHCFVCLLNKNGCLEKIWGTWQAPPCDQSQNCSLPRQHRHPPPQSLSDPHERRVKTSCSQPRSLPRLLESSKPRVLLCRIIHTRHYRIIMSSTTIFLVTKISGSLFKIEKMQKDKYKILYTNNHYEYFLFFQNFLHV